MTTTNPNRVRPGVPTGGQYAHKTHGEVELTLRPSVEGTGLPLEELVERAIADIGEGVRPYQEDQVRLLESDEARELYRRSLDSRYNSDSRFMYSRTGYETVNASLCNRMTGLGIEDPGKYATQASRVFGWTNTSLEEGVTQERMDVLDKIGTSVNQWSGWEKQAYLNADIEDLRRIAAIPASERLKRYEIVTELLGDHQVARLEEAKQHGLGDKGLIEFDHHSVEKLAALKALLPKSKQNAYTVGKLADAGVTPEILKTYGAKMCEAFPVMALKTSKLKPAVLKSLHNGHPRAQIQELEELHEGGFTKGAELKTLLESFEGTTVKQLIAARKAADPEQVARWSGIVKRKLTLDDVKAVGTLAKHGYTDRDDLKVYLGELHTPANELLDRTQSVIPVWASIVKAGITPEKLKVMTRAGIPVDKAADFAKTTDLWAAGAPFREAIAANRQRRIDQGWTRNKVLDPWEFTEADYQQ